MKLFNNIFKSLTFFAAILIIVFMVGIFAVLLKESLPAIKEFGLLNFITTAEWNYTGSIFGGARPLTGTLITTVVALILAVPVSLGIAIFLTEICPNMLKGAIGTAIELLAAIPSIIYGMWGLFVLAPAIDKYVQPLFAGSLGLLPLIGGFFRTEAAGGLNIFTASVILGIMIIPFIASVTRDAFLQVSPMLKESAYGIGTTKWETVKDIVIPYSKLNIVGGIIIATGRALGETMAVAYVIGNRHGALHSIFDPFTTITSVLANEFNEAAGIQLSSLFMLAFILFLVNIILLSGAKFMLRRSRV